MGIPLNIDLQQIFLHLFNFLILATGLYLLLYKPVRKYMEKRTQHYLQLDNKAKEKLERAEELRVSYQESLDRLEEELSRKRVQAAQEAQQASADLLQNTRQEAEKIILDAQEAAKQEYEKILRNAQQEIAMMAILATEKLIAQSASSTLDQFLDTVKKE